MGMIEHKQKSAQVVNCAVLTVSDTRDETTDKSGNLIISFLEET